MRYVVALCLLTLAVPVLAGDPGDPDLALEPLTSWIGKHLNELYAQLGKPTKTRWGKDGKVLVYRLHFYGKQIKEEQIKGIKGKPKRLWTVCHSAPSDWTVVGLDEAPRKPIALPDCRPSAGAGADVIATQKAKFYVDAKGIIQREEFGPRKQKRKP